MDDKNSFPGPQPAPQDACRRHTSRAGVYLTLLVPRGKRKHMCRILKPIVRDVRGLAYLLDVTERADNADQQGPQQNFSTPSYTVSSQELSAPALTLMLFLPEHSKTGPGVTGVRQKFRQFPWRYHHAIQLQSTATKSSLLGQQDFYFLSRQLPLWSVSAGIHKDEVKVRFNLFVRRFNAMVEFYRLVTDSEMESRKAGFCVFPLSPELLDTGSGAIPPRNDITCELALKQCPLVNPYPLADAYLSFPVNNLESLLNILPTQAKPLSSHRYLVHDPDGNAIVLLDSSRRLSDVSLISGIPAPVTTSSEPVMDKTSEHGFSIDSGRYSDFETSSFELENCMSKLVEEFDLLRQGSSRGEYDPAILSGTKRSGQSSVCDGQQGNDRFHSSSCQSKFSSTTTQPGTTGSTQIPATVHRDGCCDRYKCNNTRDMKCSHELLFDPIIGEDRQHSPHIDQRLVSHTNHCCKDIQHQKFLSERKDLCHWHEKNRSPPDIDILRDGKRYYSETEL